MTAPNEKCPEMSVSTGNLQKKTHMSDVRYTYYATITQLERRWYSLDCSKNMFSKRDFPYIIFFILSFWTFSCVHNFLFFFNTGSAKSKYTVGRWGEERKVRDWRRRRWGSRKNEVKEMEIYWTIVPHILINHILLSYEQCYAKCFLSCIVFLFNLCVLEIWCPNGF